MPDPAWVTFWTVTVTPRTVVSKGDLQVVLDHHGEAAELLVIAVCVDRGLFNERVQFSVAQFRHEGKRTRQALPVQASRSGLCGTRTWPTRAWRSPVSRASSSSRVMGLIAAEVRRRESRAGLRDFLERPPVRSYGRP